MRPRALTYNPVLCTYSCCPPLHCRTAELSGLVQHDGCWLDYPPEDALPLYKLHARSNELL